MSEQSTIPAYGVSIAIEDATVSLYVKEKALDAIQEQVVDELNESLERIEGRRIVAESDPESLHTLRNDLHEAYELAANAWEIAVAKEPEGDEG